MAFTSVTKHLRDGVVALLGDPTVGFNATLATACAAYGVDAFEIDIADPGKNFFLGHVTLAQLELSEFLNQLQVMCLYTLSAEDGRDPLRQLNSTFSGVVTICLDIYLMYLTAGSTPGDFETLADAVTDTVVSVFSGDNQAHWPARTTRKWELTITRSPVAIAGANWTQLISFHIPFEVIL